MCPEAPLGLPRHPNSAEGRKIAEKVLASFPSCPVRDGGTEAMNGLIEVHHRVARRLRNRETTASGCC